MAIGLLAAVAVAAAAGERSRRRAVEAFRASQASPDGPPQTGDLEPGWDPSNDEMVATIDYEGLDEPDQDA